MAYLTKDHFEYLATWKDKKYDSSDTDHIQAFQKLKDSYIFIGEWADEVQKRLSKGKKERAKIIRNPAIQNVFQGYQWAKIYPNESFTELAYTVGIDAELGFEIKIDTVGLGTDETPENKKDKKRKKYEEIRGVKSNSSIVSILPSTDGLEMDMEKLVQWTIDEFEKFSPTYQEICQKLGLYMSNDTPPDNKKEPVKHALNQILYGPAGTGKTYNTINYALSILNGRNINDPQTENDRKIFKKYMDEGKISFVTFHQSYGYEDFIEGIRVDKNDQDQLTYDVKSGVFQEICDRAIGKEAVEQDIDVVLDEFAAEIHNKNLKLSTKTGTEFTVLSKSGKDITVRTSTTNELYISKAAIKAYILEPSENIRQNQAYAWSIAKHLQNSRNILKPVVDSKTQPYVLIIDEINRGNISKIFGELITLIEDSKRAGNKEQLMLTLPSSNKPFSVPKNLYIIGTMNSSDRSLTSVDIALRRRFEFIEMQPQPKVLKDIDIKELGKNAVSNILEVMNKRIKVLLDRDHCIGHAYFTPLIEDPSLENLMHIFEKRIIPLLQEYFFDDWTKINLVLGENGMVHTMNLDSTLFLSMNPSEIEHLKKRNWDVNNYLFQDAPLAIKVNALEQIISPKQDYKIPKLENTVKEAS